MYLPHRKRLIALLKVLAAVVVVAGLIQIVEPEQLVESARGADMWPLLAAAALLPANLGLELWLWHRLLCRRREAPPLSASITALFCGHSLGIVTPARAGEIVARATYARHPDAWSAGALAVVHRVFDFQAVVALSLPAYVYFAIAYDPTPAALWWGLIGVGTGALVFVGGMLFSPERTHAGLSRLVRRRDWMKHLEFLRSWPGGDRLVLLALAVARYAVYLVQFGLLLHAFDPTTSYATGVVMGAIVFYGKLLIPPITFTDIGIREAVSIFVAGYFGASQAGAFNAAFFLFTINLVVPALAGIPMLFRPNGSGVADEVRTSQ